MLTSNISLSQLQAYNKETVFQSGEAFQIQKVFTLTSGATYYLAIDYTACVNKKFGIFPVIFASTAGLCLAYTYKSTLSAAGTEIPSVKINEDSSIVPLTKIYKGCTPTTTTPPDNAREYTIGTKSTNQSSGSGNPTIDITKELLTTTPTIIKLINQETSDNMVTVGIVWFEY